MTRWRLTFSAFFIETSKIQTMKHAPLREDAPESLYFSLCFPGLGFTTSQIPRPIIRPLLANQREAGRSFSQSEARKQTTLRSLTSWPLSTLATCQSWIPVSCILLKKSATYFRKFCFNLALPLFKNIFLSLKNTKRHIVVSYVKLKWEGLLNQRKTCFFWKRNRFSRHLFIFVNSQKLFLRQYICLFPGKKNPRIYERQYLQLSPWDIIIIP